MWVRGCLCMWVRGWGNNVRPLEPICIHTYTYIYIHIHTYTYIYIHIHPCVNIHIHTYTYMVAQTSLRNQKRTSLRNQKRRRRRRRTTCEGTRVTKCRILSSCETGIVGAVEWYTTYTCIHVYVFVYVFICTCRKVHDCQHMYMPQSAWLSAYVHAAKCMIVSLCETGIDECVANVLLLCCYCVATVLLMCC